MTREEITHLLAVVQTYDSRTVGESDVIAWHGALGDLRFVEARAAAVEHYKTSTDRIMPAHIRRRALAVRQDEAMRDRTRALTAGSSFGEMVGKPDWFDTTVAHHKERTRADNDDRVSRGMPRQFGETVMTASDRSPR